MGAREAPLASQLEPARKHTHTHTHTGRHKHGCNWPQVLFNYCVNNGGGGGL